MLFYREWGSAHRPALVFIHGIAGSMASWVEPFVALQSQYRIILIDCLGFGQSPKPRLAYTVEDHLTALQLTLQHLHEQRPLHELVLVGHSMGALLCAHLAVRYNGRQGFQIRNVILISMPVYHSQGEAARQVGSVSLFNRWMALETPIARVTCWLMCHTRSYLMPLMPLFLRDVPPEVAKDSLRHTWWSYSGSLREVVLSSRGSDLIKTLAERARPVLYLHGIHDVLAPLANLQEALSHLASLHLHPPTLELIDGGHDIVFTHAQACCDLMTHWLEHH